MEQVEAKSYKFKKNRGKEREYVVNNSTLYSSEQAQKIVDLLVESVFNQLTQGKV